MQHSHFRMILFGAAFMLLCPVILSQLPQLPEKTDFHEQNNPADTRIYRILQTATGEIKEIPLRDYLIGAVGAEMPASYAPEALKAQTVAVHTYAERLRQMQIEAPDAALMGADFSDDSQTYIPYYTTEQLQEFYGETFPEQYEKLAAAVDAVSGELLCFEGEPIVAAFHAISAGQTESAENIWGYALPYLIPVSSDADKQAPQYETVRELPAETVKKALTAAFPGISLPEDPKEWFSAAEQSDSGTVLHLRAGSELITGTALRDALSLRSACFSVRFADGQFRFTVHGYGHGVGMSQFGANAMALQGASYREILLHYYPDTELRSG